MLYRVQIKEQNGEQEYTHDTCVNAPSLEEATRWAETFTAEFYDEAEALQDGGYEIDLGTVYWHLNSVCQCDVIQVYDTRKVMLDAKIILPNY